MDKQQIPHQPPVYEIHLKGFLPNTWSSWFDGLVIQHDVEGNTTLTGPMVDQAALHGLLERVRDLGLPLLAVRRLEDIDR